MTISIVTYCWAGPRDYAPWQVNVLAELCRKFAPPHRFVCVTDGLPFDEFSPDVEVIETPRHVVELADRMSPEGERFPSSYRRLWTLSKEAAALLGERVMLLDVDCIPCGSMAHLFDRPEPFVGWRPNSRWGEPDRLAGGTWLHTPGTLFEYWERFAADPDGQILAAATAGFRGSDQALLSWWLHLTAAVWNKPHGIYQAQDYKRVRPRGQQFRKRFDAQSGAGWDYEWTVPQDACLLHLNGVIKPWHSNAQFIHELYMPYAAPYIGEVCA